MENEHPVGQLLNRIHLIRGQRVMLNFDLAALYGVTTKVFNQSVKRNSKRFPADFMFQLEASEWTSLRSQFVTLEGGRGRYTKYLPYAFTEQGVAMLSGILNSDTAVAMNIAIMRTFVELRRTLLQPSAVEEQLRLIQHRLSEHDVQLSSIYDAIENLLDDKAHRERWEDRERIGFKNSG